MHEPSPNMLEPKYKSVGRYRVMYALDTDSLEWWWSVTDPKAPIRDDDLAQGCGCVDETTALVCAEAVIKVLEAAQQKGLDHG